jgi:predicted nucleotidyltransferase
MIAQSDIDQIKDIIVEKSKPDRIYIFGSYARGDYNKSSDLDLLIMTESEKNLPRYKRGLKTRLSLTDFNIPMDILFYTNEEIKKWENVKHSFIYSVLKEGRILYERN